MEKPTSRTRKKRSWFKIVLSVLGWTYLYLLFASLGFILGMAYQQVLITQEVAHVLSYTDLKVEVNFNATEFTNELNRTFIPAWKTAFNETLNKEIINKT